MARYNTNTKKKPEKVTNHQGGTGYKLNPKMELIGILSTGFNKNYYESMGDREKRFKELIISLSKTDVEFVAKAMVYARSVIGQRSVTHFGSVALTPYLSGTELGKRFFSKRNRKDQVGGIVHRVDDMLEIIAAYKHFNPGKPLPNSMKKGFCKAIESADRFELSRYQGKGKSVSMVDVVNLVHPVSSEVNGSVTITKAAYDKAISGTKFDPKSKKFDSKYEGITKIYKDGDVDMVRIPTLHALVIGELKQIDTSEAKNSDTGQKVAAKVKSGEITRLEAKEELAKGIEDNFGTLIKEHKIGYIALIRNLKNILKYSSNKTIIDAACKMIVDKKLIKQSLVFPHQIDLALEMVLQELGEINVRPLLTALDKAYELSVPNLTELFTYGKTAVVYDTSGSMQGGYWGKVMLGNGKQINKAPVEKAALVAATLAKGIDADVYQFATSCCQVTYNPLDSVNSIKTHFTKQIGKVGHGTSFSSIATTLKSNRYDRVFIISDMQGRDEVSRANFNNNPHIYNVDITSYGTTMFKPGNKNYQLFGYTAELYELIGKVEINPKELIEKINAIVI